MEFVDWWKTTGQYKCCMEDNSAEEYKRVLLIAWQAGRREALKFAVSQINTKDNPIIAKNKIEDAITN